jgi:hypothetical protein
MRRNRVFACLLTGLIMMIIAIAGCGKKGDPIPPRIKLPVVHDLTAVSLQQGIVLSWSLDVQTWGIGGFKILRSVTNRGAEACPGCPQDYRPFAEVAIADGRLRREGVAVFRYTDTDVRGGSFYTYRLTACDRTGYCGEESNEAGRIHTGQ